MKYWTLLLLFLGACQSPSTTTQEQVEEPIYQGFPKAQMQRLIDSCDYVDYILYHYNFSMSQGEKNQIMTALQCIGPPLKGDISNCSPQGRIFFQSKGENIAEADIYFSDDCAYYFFLEKNQPTYANALSQIGIAFYDHVFSQFKEHKRGN